MLWISAGASEKPVIAKDGLTTHTIAYGSTNAHRWLKRVAEVTGGTYTIAGRPPAEE
jgi:hypothetical protein